MFRPLSHLCNSEDFLFTLSRVVHVIRSSNANSVEEVLGYRLGTLYDSILRQPNAHAACFGGGPGGGLFP